MWPFHYGFLFTLRLRQSMKICFMRLMGTTICSLFSSSRFWNIFFSAWTNLWLITFNFPWNFRHGERIYAHSSGLRKSNNSMKIHHWFGGYFCHTYLRWKRSGHTQAHPVQYLINSNFLPKASNKHSTMNNLLCVLERNNLLYFGIVYTVPLKWLSFSSPEHFSVSIENSPFYWFIIIMVVGKQLGFIFYTCVASHHCHRRHRHRHRCPIHNNKHSNVYIQLISIM